MVRHGVSIRCTLLTLCLTTLIFDVIGYGSQVICSQGLSNCIVKDEKILKSFLNQPDNKVVVTHLNAHAKLCCQNNEKCALCLAINTTLSVNIAMEEDGSSGHEDEDDERVMASSLRASINVCYGEGNLPVCNRVEFTVNTALNRPAKLSLIIFEPPGISFSSRVLVYTVPSQPQLGKCIIDVPSLDKVCLLNIREHIKECNVPRLIALKQGNNGFELQFDGNSFPNVCLQYESNGKCKTLNETTIPVYSVTSCLCLLAWWESDYRRSHRSRICPFTNQSEVSQHNMWSNLSLSVGLAQMENQFLLWNLSAPCRLEAEVWPCQMNGFWCDEIKYYRQELSNQNWIQNSNGLWEVQGAFEVTSLDLSTCVMMTLKGMQTELGPYCIRDINRWRWSLLVVAIVLLFCLTVLASYVIHGKIKGWAWRWHYSKCVQAVSRHVVLLSPPDVEGVTAERVCRLGSRLCDQGLVVTVDQWSRADQCSLGPLPWLHAQLQRSGSLGVRVVLVLTRNALERAEEWARRYRDTQSMVEDETLPQAFSPYSDVFTACLWCIMADQMHGRAANRYILVDFEGYPAAQTSSEHNKLPDLLHGLPRFHLPYQTEALLLELAGRRKGGGVWS